MSSPSKSFIFCVHAHQPVGNFGWVFEEAYQKSYKPFFEVVSRHPKIPVSAHFSGSLIDWLEKNKPDFIALLKSLSERGQLEFIGGAYYEPIYGLIPEKDLKGQVQMMKDKIYSLFHRVPEGVWLTERVWDAKIVKPLAEVGMQFTILDDLHFEKIGIREPVMGYYETKTNRDSLDLFASMKHLRYLMPFRQAEETIQFITQQQAEAPDVFVFADDIEKFGMWPGTYDWVYKEGWLDQFLTQLERAQDNIRAYSFHDFRKTFKPKGQMTIPHASYAEMMEWSGGYFYNFFKKYSESRYMCERMQSVSQKLQKIEKSKNLDAAVFAEAQRALYRAQCNCSYWHGVFGGLYLHHLRSAVFENLIQCEALLQKASHKAWPKIESEELESGERVRMNLKDAACFFTPNHGAALEELDFIPVSANLMCNLKRRKETYHEAVLNKKPVGAGAGEHLSIHEILGVKEEGLEKHLQYDQFSKFSFMDHFFEKEIDRETFGSAAYAEAGDFADGRYEAKIKKKPHDEIHFFRRGTLKLEGRRCPMELEKIFIPKGTNAVKAKYVLTNRSARTLAFAFGVEFNFSIGDQDAMKGISRDHVRSWIFRDSWRNVELEIYAGQEWRLLTAAIETVSESESGLERTYQELGTMLQRNISLKPKESVQYELELTLKKT